MRTNRRRGTHPVFRAVRRAIVTLVTAAALVVAAAAAGRALAWAKAHPYFAIREVDVEIKGKLDPKVVMSWAGLATGMSIWDVRAREIEERLTAHPRIRGAAVERRLPNQVKVKLEERRAVALLLDRDRLFVGDDGIPFPPLEGEPTGGLPYLSGLAGMDPSQSSVEETLRHAARLIGLWQAHAEWPALSEIKADGQDLTAFPVRTPMVIRFAADAREQELSRLAAVLELWRGRESKVAAIDLSLPGQAVIQLRAAKRWKTKLTPHAALRAGISPTTGGGAVLRTIS